MNRCVFLDRDGILVKTILRDGAVSSPWSLAEFEIINEAEKLVAAAKEKGYLTIVVTNQPDIARGNLKKEELRLMHEKLRKALKLDYILASTSADDADFRRKPNPGMLLEAARLYEIDLALSLLIGDSLKDIEAGRRAGVKSVLLETEYNLASHGQADYNCKNLSQIIDIIKER